MQSTLLSLSRVVGRVRCRLQTYQKFTVILHSIWIIIILSLANPWSQIFPVSFSLPLRLTGSPSPSHLSCCLWGWSLLRRSAHSFIYSFAHLPKKFKSLWCGKHLPSADESNRAHPNIQCGRKEEAWIQLLAHHDEESNCFCKNKKQTKKTSKSNRNLTLLWKLILTWNKRYLNAHPVQIP